MTKEGDKCERGRKSDSSMHDSIPQVALREAVAEQTLLYGVVERSIAINERQPINVCETSSQRRMVRI